MALKKFTLADIKITKANRDVKPNHVERLKEIIRKHGYLKCMPIIIDEDGCIIDGQHRYLACKELGIEPSIVVGANFDLVATINSTQLRWSTKDYVKYYADQGYEHYVVLQNICDSKQITPTVAFNIIFGKTVMKTGLEKRGLSPLKDGSLKLPDISDKGLAKLERKIDLVLNLVSELGLPRTDRLIVAISRIAQDNNFVFSVMSEKLAYQRSRIYRCSTIQEYTQMLANIYNNKNRKKIAV